MRAPVVLCFCLSASVTFNKTLLDRGTAAIPFCVSIMRKCLPPLPLLIGVVCFKGCVVCTHVLVAIACSLCEFPYLLTFIIFFCAQHVKINRRLVGNRHSPSSLSIVTPVRRSMRLERAASKVRRGAEPHEYLL